MSAASTLLTAATLTLAIPFAAHADDYAGGAVKSMQTSKGEVLTDQNGMTLYTFDKDGKDASNCYDACAAKWPPLAADASAKADVPFSLVTRKDGSRQWAHEGRPLYLWQADKKPGDVTGDGVGGIWHVAKD